MNQKYFEFIEECKLKNPEKFHKHHIIPRYLGGGNEKENLVKLSYEDHFRAHILLAESFHIDSDNYNRNMWAASWLRRWIEDSNKYDITQKLSEIRKGKTFEELFGEEKAKIAKEKMQKKHEEWWKNLSKEQYLKQITKQKNGQQKYWENDNLEHRKKISDNANSVLKNWQKNATLQKLEEYKEKRSKLSKTMWANLSDDELKKLKVNMSKISKEWWDNASTEEKDARNKKISEATKGKKIKPETTEKWRKTIKENGSLVGEKNPMFGKKHSDETKQKISENKKGKSIIIKPTASFIFFKDGVFVQECIGQKAAREFCKNQNISFQTLCKITDTWRNWYCKRNKK